MTATGSKYNFSKFDPEIVLFESEKFATKELVRFELEHISVCTDLDSDDMREKQLDGNITQEDLWRNFPINVLPGLLSNQSIYELHKCMRPMVKSSQIEQLTFKMLFRPLGNADDTRYYPWALISEITIANSDLKILAPLNVALAHNIITSSDHLTSNEKAWYVTNYMNLLMSHYDVVAFRTIQLSEGSFTDALLANKAHHDVDRAKVGTISAKRVEVLDYTFDITESVGRMYIYQTGDKELGGLFDSGSDFMYALQGIAETSSGTNFKREMELLKQSGNIIPDNAIEKFNRAKFPNVLDMDISRDSGGLGNIGKTQLAAVGG